MATFVYKCPTTGQRVQGWVADNGDDNGNRYHAITCLACFRVHSIDPKNGKVLGTDEE